MGYKGEGKGEGKGKIKTTVAGLRPSCLRIPQPVQKTLDTEFKVCVSSSPMEQAMETVSQPARKTRPKNLARLTLDMTIKTLIGQGLSVRQVAATLKCSPTSVQRVRDAMKEAGQDPQALVSASRNELLGKVYDRFLQKGMKINKVRASDVVAVAKDYRSVAFPSRQEGGGDNYSFVQINMNAALPTTTGCALGDGKTVDAEILNENRDDNVL